MGWLGWTEEELNRTTLTAIETAYKGKREMLEAIFGSGEKEKPKPKKKVNPDEVLSFAQTHNAVVGNGSR